MSNNERKEGDIVFKGKTEAIYKVIVVGDPHVGKTELLTRFAHNKFEEKYLPTVGVSIFKTSIELRKYNATVNLMFWIIAGQPQFYMLHRPYFNGADGILLVFDTTRSSTFSNINNWWNSCIKFGLSGVPRILIGNKVDLKDERKIILPMAENLNKKLNAPYFETSALTGENIRVAFQKIAELIYRAQKPDKTARREEELNVPYGVRIKELDNSRNGHSLCYLDEEIVERMRLRTNSIIKIQGKKNSTGIVVSSNSDRNTGIIRLGELQLLNAGVKVGDFIRISKAEVFLANEIELTPTSAETGLIKQKEAIKAKIINKPVVMGDIIEILGAVYKGSDPENPVNRITKLFSKPPRNLIGSMRMVVEKTQPPNKIVKITRDTKITVNNRIAILNNSGKVVSYEYPSRKKKDDSEYRRVIEDLLIYTENLEDRIENIETEKHVINLERKKLEYGKRILNDAIERLTNITSRLLDSPQFSDALSGNLENKEEEGGIDEFKNIEKLNRNLTKLENLISNKTPEENNDKTGYCRYCGGEVEEHQIYCRHCGTKV